LRKRSAIMVTPLQAGDMNPFSPFPSCGDWPCRAAVADGGLLRRT